MPGKASETPTTKLTPGHVLYVMRRQKWTILSCISLGLLATVLFFVFTPRVYRSEAKLLVRYVAETTVLDATAEGGRIVTPDRYGENIINSEVEILTSRDLIEKVVDEIGSQQFATTGSTNIDRADALLMVERSLHIELPKHSNILRLSYDSRDPGLSQKCLRDLIDLYLQKHIEIHRSVGAYDFLAQQTDQIRAKLNDTEEELRKLKAEAGVASVEDAKKELASRLQDLNRMLLEAEGEMAGSQAKMQVMSPLPASGTGTLASARGIGTNAPAALGSLYTRLQRLQKQELLLLATYTENSIPVQNVRAEIAATKKLMGGNNVAAAPVEMMTLSTNFDSARLAEQATLASLQAKSKVLKGQMEVSKGEAKKIEDVEGRITQLERMKEIQEANYKNFSKGLEQARIDDALDAGKISNISIVQPASYPTMSLRPNLLRNVVLSLLLGFLAGVFWAFVYEDFVDPRIRQPVEAEDIFRAPLLVSIPRLSGNGARTVPSKVKGTGSETGSPSKSLRVDMRDYFEALESRITARLEVERNGGPLVLGVTSCLRGVGVSTLAAGLAVALTQEGNGPVLLLDVDPLHGGAHQVFGVSPTSGMVDVIRDQRGNTAVIERNL